MADIQQLIDGLDDFLIDGATLPDGGAGHRVNEPDSGTVENNIYGTGYLSLSWRSTGGGVLPKGTTVRYTAADPDSDSAEHEYVLPQAYVPTANGDGTWTYSPKFSTVGERLEKILFYINSMTSDGDDIRLYTFYFSGQASGIISALNACLPNSVVAGNVDTSQTIYVNFDGDSIKSAAQKVATALDAQITVNEMTVTIEKYAAVSNEVYDQLLILGGTRNMGKKTLEDSTYYAAITQRLMLPNEFPNSIFPSDKGQSATTKILIFDDIYPEMRLTIGQVNRRYCWMLDENGEKVVDHIDHWEKDGESVPEGTEGAVPVNVYKKYIKFYITLSLDDEQYTLDPKYIIAGKPLGILFQSGILMGREFDLAMFTSEENEHMDDDISGEGYTAHEGEFRIIMQADGSTLLPNESLYPSPGDVVTLTGVALDESYTNDARKRLLERAQEVAPMYLTENVTEAAYEESDVVDDFLLNATLPASQRRLLAAGRSGEATYVTTSVKTDLVTGRKTVATGTFQPQGLLSSMVQKVDGVSLSGGSATMGAVDAYTRNTAPMGIDQLKALLNVGGHLGMVTVNNRFDANETLIGRLQETFDEVKEQADKKFDIWFVEGTPSPLEGDASATPNFPASEWATDEEKDAHVQDVCYDITQSAGATGGRMWRWVKDEESDPAVWYWQEIDDGDTLASLEQIADLSADNILTPAEKLVIRRDWEGEYNEYLSLAAQAANASVDGGAYICAYFSLWSYLNDNSGHSEAETPGTYRWIGNAHELLTVTPSQERATEARNIIAASEDAAILQAVNLIDQGKYGEAAAKLVEYITAQTASFVPSAMLTSLSNTVINGAVYKELWNAYWEEKTALMTALSEKSIQKLDDMASDNVLTDIEKQEVRREYKRVVKEVSELNTRASEAGLSINDHMDAWYMYREAYSALYAYLDDLTTSGYTYADFLEDPAMLYDDTDTGITGTDFTRVWENYYKAASDLRSAIQSKGVKVFVTTSQSTPPNPTPPYKAGDLWVHTENGKSTLKICITPRVSGSYTASDWVEHNIYTDPRSILAALGDMVFGAKKESISSGNAVVTVDLTQGTPTISPVDAAVATEAAPLLTVLKAMLGGVTLTITCSTASPTGTAGQYSLWCKRVAFRIPDTNDVVTGGCQISMYNENCAWEFIQQTTSSILDNLGTAINAVVFGSSAEATEAGGLTVGQRFAKMFAAAQIWDSTANEGQGGYVNLAQALFGLNVELWYRLKNGTTLISETDYNALSEGQKANYEPVYVSSAGLSADKINFAGKTIVLGATDQLSFSGGIINFTAANQLNINASQLNWNGQVISSGTKDGQDVNYFKVESNGQMSLDCAFINNAAIREGSIENVTIRHASIESASLGDIRIGGYMFRGLHVINNISAENGDIVERDGAYYVDLNKTGLNIQLNLSTPLSQSGDSLTINLPTNTDVISGSTFDFENAECIIINTCNFSGAWSNQIKVNYAMGQRQLLQYESATFKCVNTGTEVSKTYQWIEI